MQADVVAPAQDKGLVAGEAAPLELPRVDDGRPAALPQHLVEELVARGGVLGPRAVGADPEGGLGEREQQQQGAEGEGREGQAGGVGHVCCWGTHATWHDQLIEGEYTTKACDRVV